MTKEELIAKQQLQIDDLKASLAEYMGAVSRVRNIIWRPEQWSTKCPEFPAVAMRAILQARDAIEGL